MTIPPPSAPKRSRVLPILITLACGFLLTLGCCFAGIATENMGGRSSPLIILFVSGIVIGLLVFIGGMIWGLVALAVHLFGSKKEQP